MTSRITQTNGRIEGRIRKSNQTTEDVESLLDQEQRQNEQQKTTNDEEICQQNKNIHDNDHGYLLKA